MRNPFLAFKMSSGTRKRLKKHFFDDWYFDFEQNFLIFGQKAYKIPGSFENSWFFRECLKLVLEDQEIFFSNSKRFVMFRRSTLRRYAVLCGSSNSFAMFRRDKHRDIPENPFAQPQLRGGYSSSLHHSEFSSDRTQIHRELIIDPYG